MFLLAVLAASPATAVPARASVRIERGVRVTADDWDRNVQGRQREIVRPDGRGGTVRIRLVEFE